MKRSNSKRHLLIFSTIILSCILLGSCLTTLQLPSDVAQTCTVSQNEMETWFESGVITKDGVVKPANGLTFSDIPFCDFYKWSEQMFLWLTSPAPPSYGGGGGRIFNSAAFYDVTPLENGKREFIPHNVGFSMNASLRSTKFGPNKLPVIKQSKTQAIFEIEHSSFDTRGRPIVLNERNERVSVGKIQLKDKQPIFYDTRDKRINKVRPIIRKELSDKNVLVKFQAEKQAFFLNPFGTVIDVESGQAGGMQVLMSQQGSLVYFQVTVNDAYAYLKTGVENGAISTNQFPTTQLELDDISNYANSNGKTLIDPEALVVELKTSWVELSSIPLLERKNFITVKATVPTYDKSNPNQWIPNGQTNTTLAMIGMHVVGSVHNHPELLWATFEHESATPNAQYTYTNNSNQTTTVPQNTQGNWILCSANGSAPFNDPHMITDLSTHNLNNIGSHTISASNTLRMNAWGNDPTNSTSNSRLISINNSVRNKLVAGDVRSKYIQTGTTWTIGGQPPGPGNQVGTNKLANSSIETYMQSTNCFTCHTTNTVTVSSVWNDLEPLF